MRFFPRRMKVAKTMLAAFVFFIVFNLIVFGPGGGIPIQHDWSRDELSALEALVLKARGLPDRDRNVKGLQGVTGKGAFPVPGYGMVILSNRPGLGAEIVRMDDKEMVVSIRGSYVHGNGCERYFSQGLYAGGGNLLKKSIWDKASIELRSLNGEMNGFRQEGAGGDVLVKYLESCVSSDEIIIRFIFK